jgi:hypothetical protein
MRLGHVSERSRRREQCCQRRISWYKNGSEQQGLRRRPIVEEQMVHQRPGENREWQPDPHQPPGIGDKSTNAGSDNRLASLNRMTASVASARSPTALISAPTSTRPNADIAPPVATKIMGIVSGDEQSRRETAANASRATLMIVISMGSTIRAVLGPTIEGIPVVGLSPS